MLTKGKSKISIVAAFIGALLITGCSSAPKYEAAEEQEEAGSVPDQEFNENLDEEVQEDVDQGLEEAGDEAGEVLDDDFIEEDDINVEEEVDEATDGVTKKKKTS